jgi:hypothetical protein
MTEHKNIFEALNAVMQQVGYVQKQKTPGLNYSFAGEAALIAAIRPYLVENGIVVVPAGIREMRLETYETKSGATMNRTVAIFAFMFAHGPSDTHIIVEVMGEGADTGDKSANKAMTGAYKYALRQTLMIETGDDPDAESSDHQERSGPKAQPGGARPAATPATQATAPHWTTVQDWKAYWTWAKNKLGLTEDEVHTALKVKAMKEYTGDKKSAQTILEAAAEAKKRGPSTFVWDDITVAAFWKLAADTGFGVQATYDLFSVAGAEELYSTVTPADAWATLEAHADAPKASGF